LLSPHLLHVLTDVMSGTHGTIFGGEVERR